MHAVSGVAILAILAVTALILGLTLLSAAVGRGFVRLQLLEKECRMLRALIDNIPDFMYVKDVECRFILANSKVAEAMGAESSDELLGKTDADFYPELVARGFYEDDLAAEIPKTIAQMFEGVTQVSTLVGAMKEFSHPGKKEKVYLDLNHAIENTIAIARNEWKYVATMEHLSILGCRRSIASLASSTRLSSS